MKRSRWRWVNLALATGCAVGFTIICARGVGPLPSLGPAFNPGTGVWTAAAEAREPISKILKISGLQGPASVSFDKNGVAYIHTTTDHDLFLVTGYLHATNRLFQMDLMRRQGEGLLSQVVGREALSSDEFEDQLGLQRTATQEWQQMTSTDPAKNALIAYTKGVNDVISAEEGNGHLPLLFKLLNYHPSRWTPVDSLVIQGDMTQTLDFTTTPLDYALLVKSLGYKQTMKWFPVLPPDVQHPYDTGPYPNDGIRPITQPETPSDTEVKAVQSLLSRVRALPKTSIHTGSNSNNWAVDGTKTASGKPMLAGDPHLNQTLPSIWYQISGESPSYNFQGVSIPGLPTILIGQTPSIAWSLTNVQNQATLFYTEKTDVRHQNEYFWNGEWRKMQSFTYQIPVKGSTPVSFPVHVTVHGPILTQDGQTVSVDWMGALPSPDLDVALHLLKVHNFTTFQTALQEWHAPSQNFVYADKSGNIGLVSAGYYPLVKKGDAWLPLSGTGFEDVVGTIPFKDVPHAYNPKSHIVFSANQREVSNNYPYYIGTTLDFFDNGYRADEIEHYLSTHSQMNAASFAQLQNDTHDYLAEELVPKLLQALHVESLSPEQAKAAVLLKNWNDKMDLTSPAASIWWTFFNQYLTDTFEPWWQAKHVPTALDSSLAIGPSQTSLVEDLETWTLHNQNNANFTLPSGTKRSAQGVMTLAFEQTVNTLTHQLGAQPSTWQWGKIHARTFPSLSQIPALGYPAHPSSGDMWTVDAADGGMVSQAGPSWRMIIDFGSTAEGVYPGGQSENPLSPLYTNQIQAWWSGNYFPIHSVTSATQAKQGVLTTWSLRP